jgi:hypothetical protein
MFHGKHDGNDPNTLIKLTRLLNIHKLLIIEWDKLGVLHQLSNLLAQKFIFPLQFFKIVGFYGPDVTCDYRLQFSVSKSNANIQKQVKGTRRQTLELEYEKINTHLNNSTAIGTRGLSYRMAVNGYGMTVGKYSRAARVH